jgi:hypothetical protein
VLKKEGLQEQELVRLTKPKQKRKRRIKTLQKKTSNGSGIGVGIGGDDYDIASLHSRDNAIISVGPIYSH